MLGTRDLKEYMRARGIKGDFIELKPGEARTSAAAARAVGCALGQIAKSILLMGKQSKVLVVMSGDRRVDVRKVSQLVGEKLRLASPREVLEETGFSVGGIPPFGHRQKIRTIADPSIRRFEHVYTSGGSENTLLKIDVEELMRACAAEIHEVSE